jgi:hypothetical protein
MFLCGLLFPLDQFFIPAPFAHPRRIHRGGISGVLIDRALRGNNLPATDRTRASAGGALLDVDIQQLALVVHLVYFFSWICDDEKPE